MSQLNTARASREINGVRVPCFIYGTAWKEEATQGLVENALKLGFTGIDTANQRKHYFELGVGHGLQKIYQQEKISREQLFLQSKFTYQRGQDDRLPYDPSASLTEQVLQSFQSSLEHLGTDYLDAYLLHGPSQREGLSEDDLEVWTAMEGLYRDGHIKLLGVSNFSARQLEGLTLHTDIRPHIVQNRCFASMGWDREVRAACQHHDIIYQGFSLLTANHAILGHPQFQAIVSRTGLTAAQVIFQACQRMGMLTLTGTTQSDHMNQDLHCDKVALTDEEVNAIENMFI
ncbi:MULTISPECIES: aldo/keto reductase [unclassified Endozoicomonas]|uniref:aldo/keto reductase family protein n=1 Tax=unclassified Endozoicomonas TaxID=2644528 RepID=UPI0021492ECB|nr:MULTISPECIES: aldo/keto reductase [unclassified Endozoicomonas]